MSMLQVMLATFMGFLVLSSLLALVVSTGLLVNNALILILLMEATMFVFLIMIYEYKCVGFSIPGFKYFFSQTIGSMMLLLGVVLWGIYSLKGSSFAPVLWAVGLSAKLGLWPMHFWVVPVCLELPYPLLGVLGVPMKVLPLSLLVSVSNQVSSEPLRLVLFCLGLISMWTGLVLGLGCSSVRGVVGASSITHSGWFIYAVNTPYFALYFLLYSFMLMFTLVGLVSWHPSVASVGLVSLAGLPPFPVFFGKMLVVSNLASWEFMFFLAPALVTSVLSLFYYLKFSFSFYLWKPYFLWPSKALDF